MPMGGSSAINGTVMSHTNSLLPRLRKHYEGVGERLQMPEASEDLGFWNSIF